MSDRQVWFFIHRHMFPSWDGKGAPLEFVGKAMFLTPDKAQAVRMEYVNGGYSVSEVQTEYRVVVPGEFGSEE